MKAWFRRWQEYVIALPIMVLIALTAWVFLGGVNDRDDLIRWQLDG